MIRAVSLRARGISEETTFHGEYLLHEGMVAERRRSLAGEGSCLRFWLTYPPA